MIALLDRLSQNGLLFRLMLLLAVQYCAFLLLYDLSRSKLPIDKLLKWIWLLVVSCIAGGKLFSALSLCTVNQEGFLYNLLHAGTVYYGGLLGGVAAFAIVCRLRRLPFWAYLDAVASVLPLGHAIGRIGCFLNGCCYGCLWDGPLAVPYIVNGQAVSVFPTWFVEAGCELLIFLCIRLLLMHSARGTRSFFYFTAYPLARFFIEFFRGDGVRGFVGALSFSQWISIFVFTSTFGVLFAMRLYKKRGAIWHDE